MSKVKEEYEYITKHVLTLEKARELFWMTLVGVVFLVSSVYLATLLIGSDCCGYNEPCSFVSLVGIVFCWVIILIISFIGVCLISSVMWDDTNTKEIKIRRKKV